MFYVPREAYNVAMLRKTLAITTISGIAIIEPTQCVLVRSDLFRFARLLMVGIYSISSSDVATIPDWGAGSKDSSLQARAALKERCDASKPLGLTQSGGDELLVIYESKTSHHFQFAILN